jgi:hypothetical protein
MKFPLSSLRERCLATLAYFDLFDYPLTFPEIQRYFLGEQPTVDDLKDFLDRNSCLIQTQDGYYFFRGRSQIILTREEREKVSEKYWKRTRFFLPFIQFVPFIKMVGVCNTLAFNNANRDSDIDLFIVAKTGRLFFVRFFTLILFGLLGVRRHGNKIAGRFCLSFYADESALNLEKIQEGENDIYLPYWIMTMKPLYGRKTFEQFARENFWVRKYFDRPVTLARDYWNPNLLRFFGWLKELLWRRKWGDSVERKLRDIQMKRHARKLGDLPAGASIVVSDHMLKFHNIDRRKDIALRFEKKMQELLPAS